jgi:hypothetical protein
VPGLLLHGAPGSGKTSISKSVVRKLEADPRIHACTLVHLPPNYHANERLVQASCMWTWPRWLTNIPPASDPNLKLGRRSLRGVSRPFLSWTTLTKSFLPKSRCAPIFSLHQTPLTNLSPLAQHTDSARARQLAEHFLDVFATSPARGVAILASCANPSALHPLLGSSHVFACKVQLRAPDKAARRDVSWKSIGLRRLVD